MPRWLYTLLLYLLLPLLPLRLLWRSRRAPAYRRRWRERFGWIPPIPPGCLWIHVVSYGETQAAAPLIKLLLQQQRRLLITSMTPTGSQRARELAGDLLGKQVFQVYLPYDYPGAVARFLDRARPQAGIIMETELWPNLFRACLDRNIPLLLANARLSARSAAGYQRWAACLIRQTLACVTAIATQSQDDADRLRELGASNLKVTGSIKFDLNLPAGVEESGRQLRETWGKERRVWIAASTHEGEEAAVLRVFRRLQAEFADLVLILVPRHPERFDRAAQCCREAGYTPVRRSAGAMPDAATVIYLGDTMGELLLLCAAAEVAFVGGSLVKVGGHNLLEPAALGVAVLWGPHAFDFSDIARRLAECGAGRKVADEMELEAALAAYLRDNESRHVAGDNARRFVARNRGALARLLCLVEQTL
jgi:3-deoxy-D-manno-octulosonic-acid transferase